MRVGWSLTSLFSMYTDIRDEINACIKLSVSRSREWIVMKFRNEVRLSAALKSIAPRIHATHISVIT